MRMLIGAFLLGALLAAPAGAGPFPGVVQLHGCGGHGPREAEDAADARFVALSYVLKIIDSFGPRSIKERCGANCWAAPVDRVVDAYGVLA